MRRGIHFCNSGNTEFGAFDANHLDLAIPFPCVISKVNSNRYQKEFMYKNNFKI